MAKKTKHIKELSILIKEYYKTKFLAERLNGQKQRLRQEIINLMNQNGITTYDNKYFKATLFEVKETRIDIEKIRRELPPEQIRLFEITGTYQVLKILPKNEEKIVKEILKIK